MIFAPFTGKDKHGSPVTFAAGLLSKENAESFSWLFQQFVRCMGVAPNMIITDQDRGMKVVVETVLTNTRHRWCMWHIMNKVADKLPRNMLGSEDLKKELNASVWSELIEPAEFEQAWHSIMEKYGLSNDEWFSTMFESRKFWVPAYFRDFPMSSLMKTTSLSESENNFFKRYSKCRANLMLFLMNYNHALEAQRSNSSKLEFNDSTKLPHLNTHLEIEKHASTIYSAAGYAAIQHQIMDACFGCRMGHMCTEKQVYKVIDELSNTFTVEFSVKNDTYICGCKMFERIGLCCSHILFVLKNNNIKLIPEKLFGGRWLKTRFMKPVHGCSDNSMEVNFVVDDSKVAMKNLYALFYEIAHTLVGETDKINMFVAVMLEGKKQVSGDGVVLSAMEKKQMIETFYGSQVPSVIDVHPPEVVKTKGSGSRLVARKEKEKRMSSKPGRKCAKCNEVGHHDSRNCDKVKEKTIKSAHSQSHH